MRKLFPVILLLTSIVVVSCTNRPRFGKSTVDFLVSSMTLEEKQSLLVLQDGHTASLERMLIPSVQILEPEEIPGAEVLLRTWSTNLAYQVGTMTCSTLPQDSIYCIMCPVLLTEDTVYSGKMTAAVACGIRDCGYGMVVGPNTPDMNYVISQVKPWAVIVGSDIPFIDSFDGPVFVAGSLSDSISEEMLDMAVAKVLSFVERSLEKPSPIITEPLMDFSSYRKSLLENGMVLLKNEGMIPLVKNDSRIALYGKAAYDFFDDSFTQSGYKLEPSVVSFYKRDTGEERKPFKLRADAIASEAAVIVFSDSLDTSDRKLIADVCDAFHSKSRKVAVILATGGPVQTDGWICQPDAILYTDIADQDVSSVVSHIFKGMATASGRLTRSWDETFTFGFGQGAIEP